LVLAAGAFFCIYIARRRKGQPQNQDDMPSQRGSSAGMIGGRPEVGEAGWGDGGMLGRRPSKLMPHDPRMDPFNLGLYVRNKSHESVNTIRDDHDYSRRVHQPKVLRAMNPDPNLDGD
jgi:cell wall integrity and stress response component